MGRGILKIGHSTRNRKAALQFNNPLPCDSLSQDKQGVLTFKVQCYKNALIQRRRETIECYVQHIKRERILLKRK